MVITETEVREWLEEVKDPEIPVLSLIDLGVITGVECQPEGKVVVNMTPTFSGCPAIDMMRDEVGEVLQKNGVEQYEVNVSFDTQWNSNMITDKGRHALKTFGLAPPPKHNLIVDIDLIQRVSCPYCNSNDTVMKTPFGPTLCRSIHYCNSCKQAFEQFKPI